MVHRHLVPIRFAALAALVAGLLALAAGLRPAGAASATVTVANLTFSPQSVTVSVGDTVTWQNNDAFQHTATSDTAGVFNVPLAANGSGSFTFTTAGTFTYHCTIHPQMTATVVVQAAAASTPSASPAASPSASPPAGAPATGTGVAAGSAGGYAPLAVVLGGLLCAAGLGTSVVALAAHRQRR